MASARDRAFPAAMARLGKRWGELLVQTGKDAGTDNLIEWSAAVAFYGLLSLFPLLLALVSVSAHFIDPATAVDRVTSALGEYLPRGSNLVRATVEEAVASRGPAGLFSTVTLLWSGSRMFGALTKALNVAYDAAEPYHIGQRLLMELGMTLTVGLLFVLSLASGLLLDLLQSGIRVFPGQRDAAFALVRSAVPSGLMFLTLFLVYRFVPREGGNARAAVVGAGAVTLVFPLVRWVFVSYLQSFTRYNLVYGSLAVVIVLLLWAWITAFLVLAGGELASHYRMMLLEGHGAEEVHRRHEARSVERKTPRPDA